LLGGRDPERRLAIMKDSRIGSFGALALVLTLLAAWSALAEALAAGRHWAALPVAAALSRAAMAGVMAWLPSARSGGLSAASGRPSPATAALAAALALLAALLLAGGAGLAAALACTLIALGLGRAARRMIGGQTGDILGATQALSFAAALALCA
ncbi:adenosylcobinamide-GDP ribazoletransferase, partial [Xinfangfangia pollutisoli]|uniref:adenosylcobinamide-GDP ribazoletransferase n=1 Tax=Xinfangfangia pollutisoli TaxID=2865960 RepID=UPI001CD41510